jgi:putative transposase
MSKIARDPLYRRHRFPAEVIAQAVWLYFRFPLSLRMVEDMLSARGITVTHQTIGHWAEKFGRHYANEIRRRSAGRLGDKWHLDELVVGIAGTNTGCGGPSTRTASSSMCWCKRQGCQAPDAQIAQGAGPDAARHDHRQASIIRCGKASGHAERQTPVP